MRLSKFLERIKSVLARNQSGIELDKKLLRNVRRHFLPSWTHFKYLKHFLQPWEKKTVGALSLIAIITVAGWFALFITRHSGFVPKNGGIYREALVGQPKYINPIYASINDVDADLAALVYSGLFRYDQNQNLIPDLAETFTVSPDLKTFNITLRPAGRWSDNEPLTVDDIVFTIETIQNPEVGSPLLPAFTGVKVEKTGPTTVRFTLQEPFANFLDTLTVGLIPEHIWSEITPANLKLAKYNLQTVGSGPWKFEKMVKNESGAVQSLTLVPNSEYYDKKPYLNSVEFKFLDNYNEAVTLLKSQSAEAISFLPTNLKNKIGTKNFNFYQFLLPQTTAIFFNGDQKTELKNLDLRRALTMAVDRTALIKEIFGEDAIVADSPLASFQAGYRSAQKNAYNLQTANDLLDKKWKRIEPEEFFKLRQEEELKNRQPEIGAIIVANSSTPGSASSTIKEIEDEVGQKIRAEMRADQPFYRADGKNILQLTLTVVDNPEYLKTGEAVAKFWRQIGISTAVRPIGAYQINREIIKTRSYQALIYGEITGADLDLFPFWHSSQVDYPGLNLARYVNRNADKLLEDARLTLDPDKRLKLYEQFQTILEDDAPAVFLFTPRHLMIVGKDIKGVNLKTLVNPSDRYRELNNWYLKTKWQWEN